MFGRGHLKVLFMEIIGKARRRHHVSGERIFAITLSFHFEFELAKYPKKMPVG